MPDNLLTHKLGPLPTWGWMGLGTGGVVGVALYMKHKAGTASTLTGTTPTATSASNVPDYVFQNYNEIPPAAAPPTATTTPPPTTQPAPGSTPTITGKNPTIGPGNQPANPGTHIYTSNGKMTLAQVAKAHKTTPAAIVATTGKNKNNISKTLAAYFKRANWNEPIPKGTTIVYTDG